MAEDAESAFLHLASIKFNAAIVDVGLPGMHGDVFAQECRRRFPAMPMLLVTGMRAREIRGSFVGDTKVEVLEKPHQFGAVFELLERLGVVLPTRTPAAEALV